MESGARPLALGSIKKQRAVPSAPPPELLREIRESVRRKHRERARATIEKIAAAHGLPPGALYAPTRYSSITRARDHAIAVLRWSTDWTLTDLGALFDVDHTSIMAAIARYEARLNGEKPR